jgi:aryl-alcohol dehydrogenase-like predicted oxidoreductase
VHYNQLGKTDLKVSAVSFGTALLGDMFGAVAESDAIAVVHRALDAGVNFFDSAPYYGGGLAERRLGTALRGRRDDVLIGTKAGRYGTGDIAFLANQFSIQRSGAATTVVGTTKARHLDSALAAEATPIDEDLLAAVLAETADVQALSWSSGLAENNGGDTCSA